MKSTRQLFTLISIILLTFSNSVKITNKSKLSTSIKEESSRQTPTGTVPPPAPPANSATATSTEVKLSYQDLVTNPHRPKCPVVNDPKVPVPNEKQSTQDGSFPSRGPYVQPNPFKLLNSKDTAYINYVYDYLGEMVIKSESDSLLKVMIENTFKESFNEAKKMKKTDHNFLNPYTAPKLLFYFSKGASGEQPFTDPRIIDTTSMNANTQIATPSGLTPPISADSSVKKPDDAPVPDAIYEAIKALNGHFDKTIFENSITPIQVLHIMREWGWGLVGDDILEIKKIVDTYDFNGDGNLNPEEFTIFQIHSTIKMGHQCLKHCLKNIIDKVLEPLFMYLDCDSDGYINSKNLWDGLKNVFRGTTNKYNMYGCEFPVELNKNYRTNSVNDLVLKASKTADGFLNKKEFTQAILSGFWERQSDNKNYFVENPDTILGLSARWGSGGIEDIECRNILLYFPKQ